jgi:Na+/H+ antiporter NhaD/arsenite permease-like protein
MLDGSMLSLSWGFPFFGLLLTIAAGPLFFPALWHAHYGKIAAGWSALAVAPIVAIYGPLTALEALVHTMADYVSFIALLFALYTVAGGIVVRGSIKGTPVTNTILMAIGTSLASIIGTTGASMILIRPLLRANEARQYRMHVIVFFIILVANVGGALTPLGDPPLFVGFLRGVDFSWPIQNLCLQTTIVASLVLAMFYAVDLFVARREPPMRSAQPAEKVRIQGILNLGLTAVIVTAVLMSGLWKPGLGFGILGTRFELQNVLRDIILTFAALVSIAASPAEHRAANGFTWEPIREVAKLFAAIFVAIIPVMAMLQAGRNGVFAPLLTAVTANDGQPHEAAYF